MIKKTNKEPASEPEKLTREEEKIIDQTVKQEVRESLEPTDGVVLTGGIDSAVTLSEVKRTSPRHKIQPIVLLGDDEQDNGARMKAISILLDTLNIEEKPKTFNLSGKADKKKVLQYCYENNISPLHFGANIEEDGLNKRRQDMLEWQQLGSEAGVVISEPLHPLNKHVIVEMAKQAGLLDLTVKPSYSGQDGRALEKIREEAFKTAVVDDPHIEKEEEKISSNE